MSSQGSGKRSRVSLVRRRLNPKTQVLRIGEIVVRVVEQRERTLKFEVIAPRALNVRCLDILVGR